MTKMPKFDKHPLPGDSIVWRNGGFTLVARIKFDDATRPREKEPTPWLPYFGALPAVLCDYVDCYSEEDIERWKNGDWCYVGIVVTAEYKGWLLCDTAASLWGLECGLTEDSGDYLSEIAAAMLIEGFQVAKAELAKLRAIANTEEN